jgi:hypothetical protein
VIALFGDLRRHNMGSGLAESIDEVGTGASVFSPRTSGASARRRPTCTTAAPSPSPRPSSSTAARPQNARNAYTALSTTQKQQINAFLNNLVLFKAEEE